MRSWMWVLALLTFLAFALTIAADHGVRTERISGGYISLSHCAPLILFLSCPDYLS